MFHYRYHYPNTTGAWNKPVLAALNLKSTLCCWQGCPEREVPNVTKMEPCRINKILREQTWKVVNKLLDSLVMIYWESKDGGTTITHDLIQSTTIK